MLIVLVIFGLLMSVCASYFAAKCIRLESENRNIINQNRRLIGEVSQMRRVIEWTIDSET